MSKILEFLLRFACYYVVSLVVAESISMFPASKVCFFLNERHPRTHNIAERSRAKDIFERSQLIVILTASLRFSAIEDASTEINLSVSLLLPP
jgi:hypothetical protein